MVCHCLFCPPRGPVSSVLSERTFDGWAWMGLGGSSASDDLVFLYVHVLRCTRQCTMSQSGDNVGVEWEERYRSKKGE